MTHKLNIKTDVKNLQKDTEIIQHYLIISGYTILDASYTIDKNNRLVHIVYSW